MNEIVYACVWLFYSLTLSVLYRCLVLLYHGLCGSGEGCCGGTVTVVHQITGHHTGEKSTKDHLKAENCVYLNEYDTFFYVILSLVICGV